MPTKVKNTAKNRKTLRVNQVEFIKLLKIIDAHGLLEQGNERALAFGKVIFYWKKGNERTPLSLSEVSAQLNKL